MILFVADKAELGFLAGGAKMVRFTTVVAENYLLLLTARDVFLVR